MKAERIEYTNGRPFIPHPYLRAKRFALCDRHLDRAERLWPEGVPLDGAKLAAAEKAGRGQGLAVGFAIVRVLQEKDRPVVGRFALRLLLEEAERRAKHQRAARPYATQALAAPIEVLGWTQLRHILTPISEVCPAGEVKNILEGVCFALLTFADEGSRNGCGIALAYAENVLPLGELARVYEYAAKRYIKRVAQDEVEAARRNRDKEPQDESQVSRD